MAKIKKIEVNTTTESGNNNEVSVLTKIMFHELDIKFQMEYILHLFVYDVNGNNDIPILISNWDDTKIIQGSKNDKKDSFLGKKHLLIKTENLNKKTLSLSTTIVLRLGKVTNHTTIHKRNLEVFATLIPAIDSVSKWSKSFEINLIH